MRARPIHAAGISITTALILAAVSTGASDTATASGRGAPIAVAHSSNAVSGTPSGVEGNCGTSEGTWTTDGVTSQNGAPTNPSLRTWGAKQVGCPPGSTVQTVVVDGYPNQAIDINFNVRIYKNQTVGAGPQPRDNAAGLICSYTNVLGTFSATGVTGAQWTIQLPASCAMNSTATVKNRWVAVQAALDQALGQWFWATQTTADFNEADWRDIPNLFGLTCRSFRKPVTGSDNGRNKLMQDCLFGGDMGERDFIMTLQ